MDLVFLHGPAAAGKLTIAREIAKAVGYPVFHNHLVVDLLTTVFPFGSEPFVRLREQMWLSIFDDAAKVDRSLLFTFTPEATVQAGFPARVSASIKANGGKVHFVRLAVSVEEQERRIAAASRHEFRKLTDVESLRRLRREPGAVEQPPTDLSIDTNNLDPGATAKRIIEALQLTPQDTVTRY